MMLNKQAKPILLVLLDLPAAVDADGKSVSLSWLKDIFRLSYKYVFKYVQSCGKNTP